MYKKYTGYGAKSSVLNKLGKLKLVLGFSAGCFLSGCSEVNVQEAIEVGTQIHAELSGPTTQDYISGVKETLKLSGSRASDTLSAAGGFSNSALYRIVMPEELQQISSTLKTFGLGKYVNSIEKHMNTGAEMASAEAKGVFIQAISDMSVSDALGILRGGDNAATNYFKAATEATLRSKYTPIVEQQLSKIGFYDEVKQFRGLYDALPINNKPSLNLEQHVVDKSLAAVFDRFSAEEAAIRADPLKKGTEFLSKIYAAARSSAK